MTCTHKEHLINEGRNHIYDNLIIDNRKKFFYEFLDEDTSIKYVLKGLESDLILSRDQLTNIIHKNNNKINFNFVDYECCYATLNDIAIIIEYL